MTYQGPSYPQLGAIAPMINSRGQFGSTSHINSHWIRKGAKQCTYGFNPESERQERTRLIRCTDQGPLFRKN